MIAADVREGPSAIWVIVKPFLPASVSIPGTLKRATCQGGAKAPESSGSGAGFRVPRSNVASVGQTRAVGCRLTTIPSSVRLRFAHCKKASCSLRCSKLLYKAIARTGEASLAFEWKSPSTAFRLRAKLADAIGSSCREKQFA